MEIKTYLSIILRRWWVVLLVTLAVAAASVYFSPLVPPKYQAGTSLRVVTPLGGSLGDVSYQTYYADRLMNTYAQIAASDQVLKEVKTKLGLKQLPDIEVKTVPGSEIIDINVTGDDPQVVAKTANTLAEVIMAESQANATRGDTSSEELRILTDRQAILQQELSQARQNYDQLVQSYSQTNAQLEVLDRTIQMKESTYQSLLDQYQKSVINEAVATYLSTKTPATTSKNILSEKMSEMDAELASLRQQYLELSTNAATYTQQLSSSRQTVQNKESSYSALLSQIDAARIAISKHETAQDVMIASPALTPGKPTGISKKMIIGLGGLGGVILGILLAFVVDSLDTRIRSLEQIQNLFGLPILGRFPRLPVRDRKAPFQSNDINVQRACWALCMKILSLQKTNSVKNILVASPNPGEGKSTIIMGIAEALAKANRKVLIVDADLRKPSHVKLVRAPDERGLGSFLRGESTLEEVILALPTSGVYSLPSGPEEKENDPAELFHAPTLAILLENIQQYDVVLFDSPALLAVPDAFNLADQMDGIVLVVQRSRTTIGDVRFILTQLEDLQNKLLGVIVNQVPLRRISGYYQQSRTHMPRFTPRPRTVSKPVEAQSQQPAIIPLGDKN